LEIKINKDTIECQKVVQHTGKREYSLQPMGSFTKDMERIL
jgi:hypothetical protein